MRQLLAAPWTVVVGIKEWIIYTTRLLYGNIALKMCLTKSNRYWNLTFSLYTGDRQTPTGFYFIFCYRWLLLYCLHYRKHGHRYFSWQDFILFYLIHVTSWLLFPCHIFSGDSDRSCPDKTLLFEISPDISLAPVGTLSNKDVHWCWFEDSFCGL